MSYDDELWPAASDAVEAQEAVYAAENGQWDEFVDWLNSYCARDDLLSRLIDEAADLLRMPGNEDEALHRVRLYAYPKFPSVTDCSGQYRAAMEGRS